MEAKSIILSKCLNCSRSRVRGFRKSHKAVFHCECGSKYKILLVGEYITNVCGLVGKNFSTNIDGKLINGRITLLMSLEENAPLDPGRCAPRMEIIRGVHG